MIEKRNFFSLFCLDLEAQLVHVNLTQLIEIFQHLVTTQVKGYVDVSRHSNKYVECTLFVCFCVCVCVLACMHCVSCICVQYLGLWDSLKASVDEMGFRQQGSKSPSQSSYSSPNNSLTTASGELSSRKKENTASPFV